jgi:NAD(P)-dependent dehydrogenase (short-subunit alcohol dehydrogenase family)
MGTLKDLKGETAVVTGAASGIGMALAAKSSALGMNVVMRDI